MQQPIIYHNPNCSKSRATLALLQEQGYEPEVIQYLEMPPDADALRALSEMLGMSIREMMRTGDALYREQSLNDASDDELLEAIAVHPALLQRPIVRLGDRAAMGRPPENVLTILRQHDG